MPLWRHHPVWRNMLSVVSLLVAFVAFLHVKSSYNARQDLALAEAALSHGALKNAIMYYERTIKWYTPGSAAVQRAVERLWEIGTQAEVHGDIPLALEAYQTLRSSLYAVQSLYVPYRDRITQSEARIAPLMARLKGAAEQGEARLAEETARFAGMLQRHVGLHLGWSVLVEAGFLGWVGGTIAFIWYAVAHTGALLWRRGLLWGGIIVVCFALWIIGMRFA